MSYYIHAIPGRLRIKSPRIKNNQNAEYEMRKMLGVHEGIATIDVNLTTGSLLVNYNEKKISRDNIIGVLEQHGYFDRSKAVNNDQYIHGAASKAGALVSKAVFGAFIDKALEGTALSLLTVFI